MAVLLQKGLETLFACIYKMLSTLSFTLLFLREEERTCDLLTLAAAPVIIEMAKITSPSGDKCSKQSFEFLYLFCIIG
uniref:Uncharacterized protein n=1 Tax=Amphimedon queenslandica TaxID=400682 RepID=A0A1X7TSK0_AMPQE